MRIPFIILVAFSLLSSQSYALWTDISVPTTNRLHCVDSAASGQVWIGGINGIYRSSNGGASLNLSMLLMVISATPRSSAASTTCI